MLRNDIGIDMLIREVLHVPCESREGRFSFLCPICKGFNTGVQYKTNLARCFDCKRNINTIDMVMIVRQCDFVGSVQFLKKLHENRSANIGGHDQEGSKTGRKASGGAQHIAQILEAVVKPQIDGIREESIRSRQSLLVDKDLNSRILRLEQKMTALGLQVEKLLKLMNRLFPPT